MERFPAIVVGVSMAVVALAGCTTPDSETGVQTVPCPADLASVPHDEMVHIEMDDLAFDPEQAAAEPGQVIMWINAESIGHTVTPNDSGDPWPGDPDGSGSSPDQYMQEGDTWLWCFEKPGTYAYHCIPHATRGDEGYKGMAGAVVVE